MSSHSALIALIPARSGSKRISDKNIRPLAGHPVMAYTIQAARRSGIFARVVVSTDSRQYAEIARRYGAEVPFLRPKEFASDTSPDIEWVQDMLRKFRAEGNEYDGFSILRPTSPFRRPETILRAWQAFRAEKNVDSLRAVEKVKQHPGKMWLVNKNRMTPLLNRKNSNGQPWHSCQTASLPEVYVQNASLEIAWTRVVFRNHSISGKVILPFFTEGYEGFDLNHPEDWAFAEELVNRGTVTLPDLQTAVCHD